MGGSWGKVNSEGVLIGKAQAFPPSEISVNSGGQRISFKQTIAHNSINNPAKYFFANTDENGITYCTVTFTPGDPCGSWQIEAWGISAVKIIELVNKTVKEAGLQYLDTVGTH